jgi:chromosome partitioning protein
LTWTPRPTRPRGWGIDKRGPGETVYGALLSGDASGAIRETESANLSLLPSGRDLVGAEIELVTQPDREARLRFALGPIRERFDYIFVDAPPSLSLLTVNALAAADSVLVPIQTEYFALEGVTELLETVDRVKQSFNPLLQIEGVVLTMYDERTNLGKQVVEDIRRHLGEKVFDTVIPRNVRLGEAPSFGKTVLAYDIKSRGAEAYLDLGRELLRRNGPS